jgi:hypothetical protein
LAHQPYRRVVCGLAQACAQESVVLECWVHGLWGLSGTHPCLGVNSKYMQSVNLT